MPPRFAYWTILAGGLPTAFRATERDDLLPTFRRIREKHPDAEMKWFARGRLWASPDDAREHAERARAHGHRDRSWRPGGDHRDHRETHKAAARARNQSRRRERFARKQHGPAQDHSRESGSDQAPEKRRKPESMGERRARRPQPTSATHKRKRRS